MSHDLASVSRHIQYDVPALVYFKGHDSNVRNCTFSKLRRYDLLLNGTNNEQSVIVTWFRNNVMETKLVVRDIINILHEFEGKLQHVCEVSYLHQK